MAIHAGGRDGPVPGVLDRHPQVILDLERQAFDEPNIKMERPA
jgi:hypothetical protein